MFKQLLLLSTASGLGLAVDLERPASVSSANVFAVPGPSSPDPKFVYYLPWANADGTRFAEDGHVNITWWDASMMGRYDLAFGPPPLTLIRWVAGSRLKFPSEGPFYLEYDSQWCILRGNVSINKSAALEVGDVYWARAGTMIGLIEPLTDDAMVAVVGAPYVPRRGPMDKVPAMDATPDDLSERYYFGREAKKIDDYVVPGAYDLGHDKISLSDPPYRRVVWKNNSVLGPHYHPTGVMYIALSGQICFPGEYCVDGGLGAVRWAAPGYFYLGEKTYEKPVNLLVLGRDVGAEFIDANDTSRIPVLLTKHLSVNRVIQPYAAESSYTVV